MNRARKAAAILLSTTVSLLATEVILRSFFPRRTAEVLTGAYPAMFNSSEVFPYRLRENYQGRLATIDFDTKVRINSLGYRGADFTSARTDAKRVLVIGDSFTFGWGVNDEDTYSVRLQRLLQQHSDGRPIEVINAGFAACYSPDTYYLYLKSEGLALKPDAIVVGLFVGNDLDSQFAFENEWIEKDAEGLPTRIRNVDQQVLDHYLVPRRIPLRYRVPLLSRSHVFQGLFDIWWELAPKVKSWLPGVAATVYAQAPGDEGVPYIYRLQYAERTEAVFKRVQGLLAAMHRLATGSGIPIYFMVIPENAQMSPDAYRGVGDIEKPQKQLAAFFESEGIHYLDLLPALREKAAGRALYFPHDGHWNALGNELAAEQLAGFLSREWLSK